MPITDALRAALRLALLAALVITLPDAVSAQSRASQDEPLPVVTRAYAIENARIVVAPGEVIDRGTIIIRNGLIESVGRAVRVPTDAQRIAGDSLVVYAGFIDGLSSAGIPEPAGNDQARERVERPGDPPYDAAGIQPQRKATAMLSASDPSVKKLRDAGFAAAHVAPRGQSMPGTGAVILLGGNDTRRMVLNGDASLLMQFEGTRGIYPSTDMAVLARIRQLYREADQHATAARMYADEARRMERPAADDVLEALAPVVGGSLPVVFFTEGSSSALQIHRVLDLQQQLGFQLILAGAAQAFDVVEPITRAGVPVVLTLGLPKDRTETNDTTQIVADTVNVVTPPPPASHFVSDFRTRSYVDVDAEKANLSARQQMERERYVRTAEHLHAAGVPFAFTTRDVKPEDIHQNLRLMVEHGLPEEAALAALTTSAAQIFGADRTLGTIEEGKIANLVLTNGPLFHEETAIRRVFVDGVPYDVAEPGGERDQTRRNADPAGAK